MNTVDEKNIIELCTEAIAFIERAKKIFEISELNDKHNGKRIVSFNVLDKILEGCNNSKCPDIKEADLEKIHNVLIDISADGYINERAYFYSKDGIGQDDVDRHCMASNNLNVVFSCKKIPNLDSNIFDYDIKDLNQCHLENAKRRKAYWEFLKNGDCKSSVSNYESASSFIENLKELQNKLINNLNADNRDGIINEIRELLAKNFHIANAIDIFRYCHLRGKLECVNVNPVVTE